jgi:hypothetical protein
MVIDFAITADLIDTGRCSGKAQHEPAVRTVP